MRLVIAVLVVVAAAATACSGGSAAPGTTTPASSAPLITGAPSTTVAPSSTTAASSTSTSTTTTTTAATTTTIEPTATFPPATLTPPPTLPSFGTGTQVLGRDVEPGVYQSADVTDSCYWERLSGLSGDLDEIIVNGTVFGGRALVELGGRDEAFSSSGCGRWVAWLGGPPVDVFGDGDWHVGPQVRPGRYLAAGDPDAFGCYWERASGFGHGLDEILANANVFEGQAIVDIFPGDVRFTSIGCGEWTLLG